MEFDYEEEKELTTCEALIMKAVWSSGKDITTMELQTILREQFDKEYALTTIRTFLTKLSDKDFVRNYRQGKNALIHPIRTEDEYKQQQFRRQTKFWYDGSASDMICAAFQSTDKLTEEEMGKIRGILDEWDIK